jgi:hypothetical protein
MGLDGGLTFKEAILMKQAGEANGRTKKGGNPEV